MASLWPSSTPAPLRVLHLSRHFLVVEKPPDLVLNSDDPHRDSLHKRMAGQFTDVADFKKYKVNAINQKMQSTSDNPGSGCLTILGISL